MSGIETELIIILRIEEGIGFDKKSNSAIVTASLGGNRLETDIVPASSTTYFNSNLVWETDKQSVKRMKHENLPLKLECYSINFKSPSRLGQPTREFIGTIILPMRVVPVQPPEKAFMLAPHWHKLVGLSPEWKLAKPQLLLFLTITRKKLGVIDALQSQTPTILPQPHDPDPIPIEDDFQLPIQSSELPKFDLPVTQKEEIFYIGDKTTESKLFHVKIFLDKLRNVDSLIETDQDPIGQQFHVTYEYFENCDLISTKKEFDGSYSFTKGEISLKFSATVMNLKRFFNHSFRIPLEIFYSNRKVGECFLMIRNFDEFDAKIEDEFVIIDTRKKLNSLSSLHIRCEVVEDINENSIKSPEIVIEPTTPKSIDKVEEVKLSSRSKVRRTFSLNLTLVSVKFNRRPGPGVWQISFHHPRADTPFAITNTEITEIPSSLNVDFKKIELNLQFTSEGSEIIQDISSDTCVITINGPHGLSASAELDSSNLLKRTNSERHGIVLMENQQGENIAMANLYVNLTDLGVNFNRPTTRKSQSRPPNHFDEAFAYNIVEKLEDWKIREQENFMIELKEKEKDFFEKVSREWKKRRSEQEQILADKMEKCEILTKALEEARKNFTPPNYTESSHTTLDKCSITSKIMMELEEKIRALDKKNQLLEMSNRNLTNTNQNLELQLIEYKNNFVAKEEVSALIHDLTIAHERLEAEQKSKMMYKEKWAILFRELNQMKRLYENDDSATITHNNNDDDDNDVVFEKST